jgi:hypothetical protein
MLMDKASSQSKSSTKNSNKTSLNSDISPDLQKIADKLDIKLHKVKPSEEVLSKAENIRAEDVVFNIKNKTAAIKNIIKDKPIYITPDLYNVFPNLESNINAKQIVNFDQLEFIHMINKDCLEYEEIYCVINFSAFITDKNKFSKSFDILLKKRKTFSCLLSLLKNIYSYLKNNGIVKLLFLDEVINKDTIKDFLTSANFNKIEFSNDYIQATKRPLIKYSFNQDKYIFKETQSLGDIIKIMDFASSLFPNNNYNIFIDSLFIPNSNYYFCYNSSNDEIINFMRFSRDLLNYPMPCRIANSANKSSPKVINNNKNIGEVFAPFINSKLSIRCYKEFIKNLYKYCKSTDIDYVVTTSEENDDKSKNLFIDRFGFLDTGILLHYGDFVGKWHLLEGKVNDMQPFLNKFTN